MHEEGPRTCPEYNQSPKPARLSLATPSDPLLDHATSKVGGDQSPFCVVDCLTKHQIANLGLPREPRERLVLEYPHLPSSEMHQGAEITNITLSAID